jgi:hypothetical protein
MRKIPKRRHRKGIHISMDPALVALLQEDSDARGVSLSKRIETLVRQALEENPLDERLAGRRTA